MAPGCIVYVKDEIDGSITIATIKHMVVSQDSMITYAYLIANDDELNMNIMDNGVHYWRLIDINDPTIVRILPPM